MIHKSYNKGNGILSYNDVQLLFARVFLHIGSERYACLKTLSKLDYVLDTGYFEESQTAKALQFWLNSSHSAKVHGYIDQP